MKELENKLEEVFVKKAPFQLPENARKWIAEYAWIFALVGVVLGAMAFFPLLALTGLVSSAGVIVGAGLYVLTAWLSLAIMLGYLVVLAIAIPKLKAMQRSGWQLVYYSALFFLVYGVLNALSYGFFALMSLVWNVAIAVVELYIIFQVKSKFTK